MIDKYRAVLGNVASSTRPLVEKTQVFETMTSGLEDV